MWGVPVEIWLAVGGAAGGVFGWFARRLWRWALADTAWERLENRDLRKALDRLRRRENAYATSFEIVCIVLPPELTREQRLAVQRARELFETALLYSESAGGKS